MHYSRKKKLLIWFVLVAGRFSLAGAPATQPYLLHIPGIGGHLPLDDNLMHGLCDGNLPGNVQLYDWTGTDRGLNALLQTKRHDAQAAIIAKILADKVHDYPAIQINITSHSGGCGIAVWALEKLPDTVVINKFVMMQSALSPEYDLTKALRHIRQAYSFNSELDSIVLGTATRIAGTVDGIQSDAAGRVGYKMPDTADPVEYKKLKQFSYDESWMQYDDIGDHVGPMTYPFARFMIAPLLKTGTLPDIRPAAATTKKIEP